MIIIYQYAIRNRKRLSAKELKSYILKNDLIPLILDSVGCEDIVFKQIHNVYKDNYYQCSNRDGDNPTAIVVYTNPYINVTNYTRNWGRNPDIITLVQRTLKISFSKAIDYLHEILGLKDKTKEEILKDVDTNIFDDENDNSINEESEEKLQAEFKKKYQKELANDMLIFNGAKQILFLDWYKEGIMPWTKKKFDIRYSYRSKRIIIPIKNYKNGDIIAVSSRTTINMCEELGIPKYIITKYYNKSNNLYGLWENEQSIRKAGYVVVYEAEKSVLKRDSLNDSTGVALQGHFISDEQVRILTDYLDNVDVIIAMDKDVSLNEVRFICEKFYNQKNVYYIIDRCGLLGEKDSPADTSNKNFIYLMDNKVKYDEAEHKQFEKDMNINRCGD